MNDVPIITPEQLVREIQATLKAKPHKSTYHDFKIGPDPVEPPAYTLILGAGFSHGVVPTTRELMHETIGGYYYPDQDQSSMQRPASVLERHSASFWAEFNNAAKKHGLKTVDVNSRASQKTWKAFLA